MKQITNLLMQLYHISTCLIQQSNSITIKYNENLFSSTIMNRNFDSIPDDEVRIDIDIVIFIGHYGYQ